MTRDEVLLDYLATSLTGLGLGSYWDILTPEFLSDLRQVVPSKRTELSPDAVAIMDAPQSKYRSEPWDEPISEFVQERQFYVEVIRALDGDSMALQELAALLVTAPLNRKLAISFFLGNLTDGQIGSRFKEIPSRGQVLEWIGKAKYIFKGEHGLLENLAKVKIELQADNREVRRRAQ